MRETTVLSAEWQMQQVYILARQVDVKRIPENRPIVVVLFAGGRLHFPLPV